MNSHCQGCRCIQHPTPACPLSKTVRRSRRIQDTPDKLEFCPSRHGQRQRKMTRRGYSTHTRGRRLPGGRLIGAIMTSRHYLDTGQRTCHADDGREIPCAGSGQDASFAVGTPWPEPRFDLRARRRGSGSADRPDLVSQCQSRGISTHLAGSTGFRRDHEPRAAFRPARLAPAQSPRIAQFAQSANQIACPARAAPVHQCVQRLVLDRDDGGHQPGARLVCGARWRAHVLRRQGSILHALAGTRRRSELLPRTGQSLCYDASGKVISCTGSGQDGEWRYGAPWPEPRFEILPAGILDRLTGLLWRRSANLTPQPVVWREALVAVAELNQEGGGKPLAAANDQRTGSAGGLRRAQPGLAVRASFRRGAGHLLVVYHQPVRARLGLGPVPGKRRDGCRTKAVRAIFGLGRGNFRLNQGTTT